MRRPIENPGSYSGFTVKLVEPGVAWNFRNDQDIKQGIGQINSTAQLETAFTDIQNSTLSLLSGYATVIQQEFIEPGTDHQVWHYKLSATIYSDVAGVHIFPFCMQGETADADSNQFNILSHDKAADGLMSHCRSDGEIIRNYTGIVADDANPFIFGWLMWNMHTATCVIQSGIYSMEVHPLSKPLIMADPGI